MTDERAARVKRTFLAVRREGLSLGMAELLAALRAEKAGFGGNKSDFDSLLSMLILLWCKSEAERYCLQRVWAALEHESKQSTSKEQKHEAESTDRSGQPSKQPSAEIEKPAPVKPGGESLGVMPARAPAAPPPADDLAELRNYYPITRRSMRYAWRYLRRMIADGPLDVLDVAGTVERTARQGFFYAPVLRRRESNHAHLVLMLDHLGSMIPFHHYLRDMVETTLYESSLGRVDIYYFYNVPGRSLYTDSLLKEEQWPLERVLAGMDEFSAVLIVSDAGAARHHNELDRILATLEFLDELREVTGYVAWLNPMPEERWQDTSAEMIGKHIKMFPMDPDGLSGAVDVLRGLEPSG